MTKLPHALEPLRTRRAWVLWKRETRDGSATKVPYVDRGRKAKSDDPSTWAPTRRATFERAMSGIAQCDVFVAWLADDAQQAHGTLLEIGYARALGEPIVVMYDPACSGPRSELWFAHQAATASLPARNPAEGMRAVAKWIAHDAGSLYGLVTAAA